MAENNLYKSFRVKTKGYTEQCGSYNNALRAFDRLRKKKESEGELPLKITLERKGEYGWEIVDSINIK